MKVNDRVTLSIKEIESMILFLTDKEVDTKKIISYLKIKNSNV